MPPEPLRIDQSLKDRIDAIEAMPRAERRKLGKKLGVKIPGSNKPHTNAHGSA